MLNLALQAVISALLPLVTLWLLWLHRGRWSDVRQRLGFYSADLCARLQTNRTARCWIHAASIGEAQVALALINAMRGYRQDLEFVVSTMTEDGKVILERQRLESVEVIFLPLDLAWCVRRTYRLIQPDVVILVEMEFWPNLLWLAQDSRIPVCVVNARMPEVDFRRYRAFAWFFRGVFGVANVVCAQTAEDAARLVSLGVAADGIKVAGGLKSEVLRAFSPNSCAARALLRRLEVTAGVPVLVAGSTYRGEEEIFLNLISVIEREFGSFILILAPRDISRAARIVAMASERGVVAVRRSDLDSKTPFELRKNGTPIAAERAASASQLKAATPLGCLVIDSIGELRDFYAIATVSFVGRSLTGYGGQNPLEPVSAGCPVIFGRNMQNFEPIAEQLVAAGVATQIGSVDELRQALLERLEHPVDREKVTAATLSLLRDQAGAMEQTVNAVFAAAPALLLQPLANCTRRTA